MSFHDFTAGQVLTAADLEQYVMRQNGKPVGFFTKSASQSINNATSTAVTWDQETFDTDAAHSTSSNTSRYTVATAGKYRCYMNIEWGGNTSGVRDVSIRVNGVATELIQNHITGMPASNASQYLAGIVPQSLIVGDYMEVYVQQTSGGALSVTNTTGRLFWGVEYISE